METPRSASNLATDLAAPASATLPTSDWVVLVYMNANNNLERFAIDNYVQMEKVGSTDQVLSSSNSRATASTTGRFGWSVLQVRSENGKDPIPANAVQNIGKRDMGASSTLQDFISWAEQRYPATHYMLVIWDHAAKVGGFENLLQKLTLQRLASIDEVRRGTLQKSLDSGPPGVPIAMNIAPEQSIPNPVRSSSFDEDSGISL